VSKVLTPTSPDELEATLNDGKVMKDLLADPKALGTFMNDYAKQVNKTDPSIAEQVQIEVQRGLAAFAKEHGAEGSKPPVDLTPGKSPQYNSRAVGAALDGVYANKHEFFSAVAGFGGANARDLAAKREKAMEIQNSFGSIVPADGGFLIPETLRSELLAVALESAVVRPRATVIPMESLRVPIPMIDSTSNATSVWGGISATWTEEGAALTESQATFGRVVLDAKKLTAYAEIPNELLNDASAFNGFFSARFPSAVSYFEDVAFFTGTGVGEPTGFINCSAAIIASAVSGQGTNTIVYENCVAMLSRMLPTSLGSCVWIASPDTRPQLMTMGLAVGTGGGPVWMSGGGYNNGAVSAAPDTLFGRPIFFSEKASVLGTTGDLSLVDLSYYLVGDRQTMQAMVSEHYKFANDKVAFRITERVDGRPWIQSAITPHNGGNSLSPFVQLSSTRT
jgi:HK97 family phage major capsid protein